MKTYFFDIIFIVIATLFLITLDYFELLKEYCAYGLIPIIAAYFIGKHSGKKRISSTPK